MKKKKKKKLELNREVIRHLQDGHEAVVGGGWPCTLLCTLTGSDFVECRPNYTCPITCVPL